MEGIKKPEKAIFDLTLERLGVTAEETVFLDDLGGNLKTARLMGMSTIKVSERKGGALRNVTKISFIKLISRTILTCIGLKCSYYSYK